MRESGFYKVTQKNEIETICRYIKDKGWFMGDEFYHDDVLLDIDERAIPINIMDLGSIKEPIIEPCYCGTKKVVGYKEKSELPINLPNNKMSEKAMLARKTKFINSMPKFSSRKKSYKKGWGDCYKWIIEQSAKNAH